MCRSNYSIEASVGAARKWSVGAAHDESVEAAREKSVGAANGGECRSSK